MDDVPARKRAQLSTDCRVRRPRSIHEDFEHEVCGETCRHQSAERDSRGAAEALKGDHSDDANCDGQIGRAQLGYELGE